MRTNLNATEAIRRTAYFLWQQDGGPDGRSLYYWLKAEEMYVRHRAYDRWLAEGTPVDRAEENWRDAAGEVEEK